MENCDEKFLQMLQVGLKLSSKTGFKMDADNEEDKSSVLNNDLISARIMFSQDPYPGDEEELLAEKEILGKWGLLQTCHEHLFEDSMENEQYYKSNKQIDDYLNVQNIEKGQKYMTDGEINKAIGCFQDVLVNSPDNVYVLQELANIYYDLEKFKEAYGYCNQIPTVSRNSEIWKLGGKILRELDLPVTAESFLRQSTRTSGKEGQSTPNTGKDGDENAALIFQQVRTKRIFGPYTRELPINIVFNEHGRSVQAQSEIGAKTLIFKDQPIVLAQTMDSLDIPACSQCARCLLSAEQYFGKDALSTNSKLKQAAAKFWPKRKVIDCKLCKYEKYCSEACRDQAWDNHHKVICPSVNQNAEHLYKLCYSVGSLSAGGNHVEGVWNASFSPLLLARIWACIICSSQQIAQERGERKSPTKEDIGIAQAGFRRFIAFGQSSNAKRIPKMVEIMRSIFQNPTNGFSYPVTEREFDGRYFQAACNVQAFSDSEDPYRVFLRLIKSKPSFQDLMPLLLQEPKEANFAGLFTLHACMNHSCANNALVLDGEVDGKPGLSVSARKHINSGDELCTTYVNPAMSRKDRRTSLFRAYNFWCECERCKYEGDDSSTCTNCGKESGSEKSFPGCGKCRRAWYCSVKCQKSSWKKGHKKICSP